MCEIQFLMNVSTDVNHLISLTESINQTIFVYSVQMNDIDESSFYSASIRISNLSGYYHQI